GPYGPRPPTAARKKSRWSLLSQHVNEGNPRTVRGERRRAVIVQTGLHPDDRPARELVDPDERVATPMAHECQLLAVRRPGQRANTPCIDDQRSRLTLTTDSCCQNPFLVDKHHLAAIGRKARRMPR